MSLLDILNGRGGGAILLAVLLIITIIISLCSKKKNEEVVEEQCVKKQSSPLNVNDENALVASLVAAIECRNEYHKNVEIISVREVK